MRPKSMIMILIALGCGLIASIGISQIVERGGGDSEVQMQSIYVAVEDIDIGEELTAQRVKLESWPIDRVPVGAITTAEQLEGQAPKQRLFSGEPILAGKLATTDSLITVSHRIKPGHRVMSVKVSMDTAVSHLIQPGDHVDILAFVAGRGGTVSKAETILSDIEVFAINEQTTRTTDPEAAAMHAKTVSLLVTPEQAMDLVYYVEQGRLRLTLRSPEDESSDQGYASRRPIEEAEEDDAQRAEELARAYVFQMEVLNGSGASRKFGWEEVGEDCPLPQEIFDGDTTQRSAPSVPAAGSAPPFQPIEEEFDDEEDMPEESARRRTRIQERGITF